jgi:hypothetical protein
MKRIASKIGIVMVLAFVALAAFAIPAMAGTWRSISGSANKDGSWLVSSTVRYMPDSYGDVRIQIGSLPHHNLKWQLCRASDHYVFTDSPTYISDNYEHTVAQDVMPNVQFHNMFALQSAFHAYDYVLGRSSAFSGQEWY